MKALVRKTSKVTTLQIMGAELVVGDLQNLESLNLAMEGCDVVFHLAAAPDYAPEKVAWSINHTGAVNMLEAALKQKVQRFVHCSTVGVIGFADEFPFFINYRHWIFTGGNYRKHFFNRLVRTNFDNILLG